MLSLNTPLKAFVLRVEYYCERFIRKHSGQIIGHTLYKQLQVTMPMRYLILRTHIFSEASV